VSSRLLGAGKRTILSDRDRRRCAGSRGGSVVGRGRLCRSGAAVVRSAILRGTLGAFASYYIPNSSAPSPDRYHCHCLAAWYPQPCLLARSQTYLLATGMKPAQAIPWRSRDMQGRVHACVVQPLLAAERLQMGGEVAMGRRLEVCTYAWLVVLGLGMRKTVYEVRLPLLTMP